MAEITKELGRIPVSRGDYQASTEYYKDNIVQYKRGSYQVVSESPIIGVPPTNDKNVVNPGWTLFAGTLDAQDVVNQIKEQEAQSIQAVADREAEILSKTGASEISTNTTGLEGNNVQDNLDSVAEKLIELESKTGQLGKKIDSNIAVYGTIDDGNIDPTGLVVIDSSINRNLYFISCQGLIKVIVSEGDMYGFFTVPPAVGSVTSDGIRHLDTLSDTEITIPDGITYFVVRAATQPTFKLPEDGLKQRTDALEKKTDKLAFDIENVVDEEADIITATIDDASYSTSGNFYSIYKASKGTFISKVLLLAPITNYTPTLIFAKVQDNTAEIAASFALAKGNGESYIDNIINYECKEDLVMFIDAFYFKALETTYNIPIIMSREGVIIGLGKVDLGISVKVMITGELGKLESKTDKLADHITAIDNRVAILSTLEKGTLNPDAVIEASADARNLYIIEVKGEQTINVNEGDLYGFFDQYPNIGVQAINAQRFVEDLTDKSIEIPISCTYLAVRAASQPTFKVVLDNESIFEKIETLEDKVGTLEDKVDVLDVSRISSDIAMFENIGFCGDSYTAGMIVVSENPTVTAENKNLCWGKIIERTHGVNSFIYALGGTSVVDNKPTNPWYLDNSVCLPKLLSESAKNLYVISLGHNDAYISTSTTKTKTEFLNEFETNYRSIISQVSAHAPNAKLILCKQSGPYMQMGWGADINDKIMAIGQDLGIPVLLPEDDAYLSSDVYVNTMVHNHPVFTGYAGIAKAFDRLFSKATIDYHDYFKGYTGL